MSPDPIRYSIVADYQAPWAKMHEFRAGGWVKWEDYARLQAEVERLRKAGDAIINKWSSGTGTDLENFTEALWLWTTAKQNKPTK